MNHTLRKVVHALLLPGLMGLALAFAGCNRTPRSATEVRAEWMDKTNQAITDPIRAQQIAEIVSRLLDSQEARAAALESASNRLAASNADYHATTEQAMAVYDEYEARQREALTRLKDDVLALRRQVSDAEWQVLVD
jgi:hypothetical protein